MAPWTKEAGPLGKAIKNGDVLKKKVDQTVKESNKLVGNKKAKDKDALLQQMYQNCIDAKTLVEDHNNLVENLKEDEEPTKMKDFEKKQSAELKRCTAMKTQLTDTMAKLLPDTTETEFIKTHGNKEEKEKDESEKDGDDKDDEEYDDEEEEEEDEEDEEEEEKDEEEDEEEEDEEKDEKPSIALKHDKLPLKKGAEDEDEEEEDDEDDEDEEEEDEEDEEEEDEDDEEETMDKNVNSLKGAQKPAHRNAKESKDDDDEEEEDDDEDEEEEEDTEKSKKESEKKAKDKRKKGKDTLEVTESTHRFTTVDDYEGEEGDLNFTKGDILKILETREDGWWLAENEAGEKGLVPSTYLQKLDTSTDQDDEEDENEDEDDDEEEEEEGVSPRGKRGKKLWGSLRTAITETSVSDVLHAMGAVPSGFRMSTLCRKFNEGDTFRMASFLTPKLSNSNLAYRDLFFNPSTNKLRPRSTRIERVITFVSGLQIPLPGAGIEVLDRHVRMCLFDGHHILSNIHSVKVGSVDKSQRSWAFTTKTSEQMDTHSHAEVFIRTNDTKDNIGLLCELCVTYCRTSSKEKGEFSCGWTLMPLLDEAGAVVGNKTFDLQVHGGTPYEKGVEVDPSISRRKQSATSNALVSLISGNKQPRLAMRVSIPKQQHKELMDTLPDTLVGSTCLLQLMSLYRQCLCDVLLRDRLDLTSTELIHSPMLKGFPQTADIPDLMKLFRAAWYEKLREVKRTEKVAYADEAEEDLDQTAVFRDAEFMKELFRLTFMESVYPVSHLASLPVYRMGDHETQEVRLEDMKRFTEVKTAGKGALAALLSADFKWQPLDLDEMAFNIIGPHCLQRTIAAES